jgi:hypothetical protein
LIASSAMACSNDAVIGRICEPNEVPTLPLVGAGTLMIVVAQSKE